MKSKWILPSGLLQLLREIIAIICMAALAPGSKALATTQEQPPASDSQAATIPPDQLDSLVAPIALYPDPMLSQVLIASTYPLEIIQLQQWLAQNKGKDEKQLADAVAKQNWDPSIQALAGLPDVVKLLADNIKWTTDLGNAFLAQQDDVMAAVQRMRKTAQDKGNLKSTEQQKVETKTVESKQVIVIEQANPEVVYVPSYNPTVVYGAPVYAYPPIAYPPPGYYAAGLAISFGVGIAMGAMWGGGWCCGAGWGNNNVTINNNNNFNRNSNRQNINNGNRGNRGSQGGRSNWQHNPQHRGGAPYGDRKTASQFGGTTRGDSMQNRQANARQNVGRQQQAGNFGNRTPSAGTRDAANRSAGAGAGNRDMGNRGAGAGGGGSRGTGADRVGNRQVPSGAGGGNNRSAFGGSGMSGSGARASQSRGSSSMGSRGGGGARGGGGRGGGGGRRR
jgi:Protein of unknown function (DUF3300)